VGGEITQEEFREFILTLKEVSIAQKQTTENVQALTKDIKLLAKELREISTLQAEVSELRRRLISLESSRASAVGWFLKTIGAMIVTGAIYALTLKLNKG